LYAVLKCESDITPTDKVVEEATAIKSAGINLSCDIQ
jgi:hypothetical protein